MIDIAISSILTILFVAFAEWKATKKMRNTMVVSIICGLVHPLMLTTLINGLGIRLVFAAGLLWLTLIFAGVARIKANWVKEINNWLEFWLVIMIFQLLLVLVLANTISFGGLIH